MNSVTLPSSTVGMTAPSAELWPKLGDGFVRKAAYRGGWKPA